MLESLKKNDKIKDFVVSTLTEKTENDRTVVAILRVMGEKYARTVSEKCLSLMADMANFKMEGGIEMTTDKFGKMMAEIKKLKLATNLNFAMTLQFMERLEKSGKISSDERMILKDEIETKDGKPKVTDSAEIVQKELKRMKIVNNRESLWKDKVTDTHYVNKERESRYGRWKYQMEGNGYKRSNSRNGFWKNGSAVLSQIYVRDR